MKIYKKLIYERSSSQPRDELKQRSGQFGHNISLEQRSSAGELQISDLKLTKGTCVCCF